MTQARGWFVTGTDTGVGKTRVTTGLMAAFRQRGLVVAGMKPVASGCEPAPGGGLENEDARQIRALCTHPVPYEWVNPCALVPPIAPSIALQRDARPLPVADIMAACARLRADAEVLVIEGVGGWLVPLQGTLDMAGLAARLGFPVLLVVGLRLGCINHALLTLAALGKAPAGWFANGMDPAYTTTAETVALLAGHIGQPPLAVLPCRPELEPGALAAAAATLWEGAA